MHSGIYCSLLKLEVNVYSSVRYLVEFDTKSQFWCAFHSILYFTLALLFTDKLGMLKKR